jgi:hypothetical protein
LFGSSIYPLQNYLSARFPEFDVHSEANDADLGWHELMIIYDGSCLRNLELLGRSNLTKLNSSHRFYDAIDRIFSSDSHRLDDAHKVKMLWNVVSFNLKQKRIRSSDQALKIQNTLFPRVMEPKWVISQERLAQIIFVLKLENVIHRTFPTSLQGDDESVYKLRLFCKRWTRFPLEQVATLILEEEKFKLLVANIIYERLCDRINALVGGPVKYFKNWICDGDMRERERGCNVFLA